MKPTRDDAILENGEINWDYVGWLGLTLRQLHEEFVADWLAAENPASGQTLEQRREAADAQFREAVTSAFRR